MSEFRKPISEDTYPLCVESQEHTQARPRPLGSSHGLLWVGPCMLSSTRLPFLHWFHLA